MKKTLIALAALAATAAFAQSTVTISGTVDAGVEKIADTATKVTGSRSGTSNVTFAGVEDLGGGLKAKFSVATKFDSSAANIGATQNGGAIGNHGMFVGVESASLGSLIIGNPVNTLYSFQQTANGTKGVSGFAATNTLITGNSDNTVYVANAVQYLTPNFAGFSAQFEYSASEVFGAKSNNSIGLKYGNGPVAVTFVRANVTNGVTTGTEYLATVNQLAGAYDFGVAKVLLTYQNVKQEGLAIDPNLRSYVLSVTAPVGPGLLWAQYGRASADGVDSATIVGLGYKYSLSKRSSLYANYGNRSDSRLATLAGGTAGTTFSTANTAGNGFGVGIQHNF